MSFGALKTLPSNFLTSGFTSPRAARIMLDGLARNRARIAFPWPLYAAVRVISALPAGLLDPLLARLPRKG